MMIDMRTRLAYVANKGPRDTTQTCALIGQPKGESETLVLNLQRGRQNSCHQRKAHRARDAAQLLKGATTPPKVPDEG